LKLLAGTITTKSIGHESVCQGWDWCNTW